MRTDSVIVQISIMIPQANRYAGRVDSRSSSNIVKKSNAPPIEQ